MEITQKIFVKNTLMDLPFKGDPAKNWFCEIIDSNHNSDGNPTVERIRSGYITIKFPPRCLNSELALIFHTEEEKQTGAVERLETNLVQATKDGFRKGFARALKWALATFAGMATLGVAIAVVSYFFNIEKIKHAYVKANAVNISNGITDVFKNRVEYSRIITNSYDSVYLSDEVKEKEKELKVKYPELFWYTGEDFFFMADVARRSNGDIAYEDKEDADEFCEKLGAKVISSNIQNQIFGASYLPFIKHRRNIPQWTSDNPSGDDFVILLEDGDMPEDSYKKNDVLIGDEDDVKVAFRCGFYKSDLIEEDD